MPLKTTSSDNLMVLAASEQTGPSPRERLQGRQVGLVRKNAFQRFMAAKSELAELLQGMGSTLNVDFIQSMALPGRLFTNAAAIEAFKLVVLSEAPTLSDVEALKAKAGSLAAQLGLDLMPEPEAASLLKAYDIQLNQYLMLLYITSHTTIKLHIAQSTRQSVTAVQAFLKAHLEYICQKSYVAEFMRKAALLQRYHTLHQLKMSEVPVCPVSDNYNDYYAYLYEFCVLHAQHPEIVSIYESVLNALYPIYSKYAEAVVLGGRTGSVPRYKLEGDKVLDEQILAYDTYVYFNSHRSYIYGELHLPVTDTRLDGSAELVCLQEGIREEFEKIKFIARVTQQYTSDNDLMTNVAAMRLNPTDFARQLQSEIDELVGQIIHLEDTLSAATIGFCAEALEWADDACTQMYVFPQARGKHRQYNRLNTVCSKYQSVYEAWRPIREQFETWQSLYARLSKAGISFCVGVALPLNDERTDWLPATYEQPENAHILPVIAAEIQRYTRLLAENDGLVVRSQTQLPPLLLSGEAAQPRDEGEQPWDEDAIRADACLDVKNTLN